MKITGKQAYPWNFFDPSRQWRKSLLITLFTLVVSVLIFILYYRTSSDISPDSIAGYAYATAGTGFLLLAALRYSLYRRTRKHKAGKLNAQLHWHISFAVIGLVLIFLHSFGNFNPRTGTYALYGLIALAVSGFIGRMLDRIMPRLIAIEVRKALTEQGEDRLESITTTLKSLAAYNRQDMLGLRSAVRNPQPVRAAVPARPIEQAGPALPSSWDLAYISLEETPQEIGRDTARYRFVPDRKSVLEQPGALMPGIQEHIAELKSVQQALQREQLYRYIIRFWRVGHVFLTLLFIGLTLWHLEYAAQLLIVASFHH